LPWIHVLERFAWDVPGTKGRRTHVYEAGAKKLVVSPCAADAVAAGKAVRIKTPTRDERLAMEAGGAAAE
jgi:hypothetical protein